MCFNSVLWGLAFLKGTRPHKVHHDFSWFQVSIRLDLGLSLSVREREREKERGQRMTSLLVVVGRALWIP